MNDDPRDAGGDVPPAVAQALVEYKEAERAESDARNRKVAVYTEAKAVIEKYFPYPIGTVFVDEAGKKFSLLEYEGYASGWGGPRWPPHPVFAAEKKGGGFMARRYRNSSWRAKHSEAPVGKLTLFKE